MRWDFDRRTYELKTKGWFPLLDHPHNDYFFDLLLHVRPVRAREMGGIRPLVWDDLFHFQALTGELDLDAGDPDMLMMLSEWWVKGMNEGKNVVSLMPLRREIYGGYSDTWIQVRQFPGKAV